MMTDIWDRTTATTQSQPIKGKTKTRGSICITVKQRQDQDCGKPEKNHISAKTKPKQGEVCAQPKPSKGKAYSQPQPITKRLRLGEPVHNHSP